MGDRRWNFLTEKIRENKFTVGAEIGVLRGTTFKRLLESNPELTLYGIDIWAEDKVVRFDGTTNEQLLKLPKNDILIELEQWVEDSPYKDRAKLIRSFSHSCLDDFEDGSLDFVFIDASHQYEDVRRDTVLWSKKVKPRGIVSGHDRNIEGVARFLHEVSTSFVLQAEIGCVGETIHGEPDHVWWYQKYG